MKKLLSILLVLILLVGCGAKTDTPQAEDDVNDVVETPSSDNTWEELSGHDYLFLGKSNPKLIGQGLEIWGEPTHDGKISFKLMISHNSGEEFNSWDTIVEDVHTEFEKGINAAFGIRPRKDTYNIISEDLITNKNGVEILKVEASYEDFDGDDHEILAFYLVNEYTNNIKFGVGVVKDDNRALLEEAYNLMVDNIKVVEE